MAKFYQGYLTIHKNCIYRCLQKALWYKDNLIVVM